MKPLATVVIPTHDHGPTLRYALHSALAQSVEAIEVFVVGDGICEQGRTVANEYAAADRRVRFFDNPKGERHGEALRHEALKQARGGIVLYLSDDDLWFDDHVERMADLLGAADLANTLGVFVEDDGLAQPRVFDLTIEENLQLMRRGGNGMSLTAVGHRLDAYRRLPHGWHPAPRGLYSDLHMWQQFIDQSWLRVASGGVPTTIHLASALPSRRALAADARCAELEQWASRLREPAQARKLRAEILDRAAHESAWRDRRIDSLEFKLSPARRARAWLERHPRMHSLARRLPRGSRTG